MKSILQELYDDITINTNSDGNNTINSKSSTDYTIVDDFHYIENCWTEEELRTLPFLKIA